MTTMIIIRTKVQIYVQKLPAVETVTFRIPVEYTGRWAAAKTFVANKAIWL